MEKEHVLKEKAFIYDLPKIEPNMDGFFLDKIKGYWINLCNNQPCIESTNFVAPRTKKCDVETGEDRKGE